MAVREFNGTSDRIVVDNGTLGTVANSAFSIFILVRPTTLSAGECYVSCETGAVDVFGFFDNAGGGGQVALGDTNEYITGTVGETAAAWQLMAVTWAGPGTTPRFHRKERGTGSWTHQDGSGAFTGSATAITQISFGTVLNGSFSSWKDMRLAVAAVWSSALTDGQIESIETTPASQTVYDLNPVSMWEFNQAAITYPVTDAMGNGANQTIIAGTTVVTGADPTGWTFGAVPDPLRSSVGFGASVAAGTSITVTKPTDAVSGDKIWAVIVNQNTSNPVTAPDGTWTQLELIEMTVPQSNSLTYWEKTAGGSEPSTYTFTQTDSCHWVSMCIAAGGGTVTRYNQDAGTDTTGPDHASGLISTTAAGDLVLYFFGQDNATSPGAWNIGTFPTNLRLLGQVWGSDSQGMAGFVEVRAAAGSGNAEATQTTGGAPTRGSVWVDWAAHLTAGVTNALAWIRA